MITSEKIDKAVLKGVVDLYEYGLDSSKLASEEQIRYWISVGIKLAEQEVAATLSGDGYEITSAQEGR